MTELQTWALVTLLFWNIAVFITYAVDKYKAKHQLWRIPEKILLIFALLGGGLGALLAGKLVHHKTRKWYFWVIWILGIMIEGALIFWILKCEL